MVFMIILMSISLILGLFFIIYGITNCDDDVGCFGIVCGFVFIVKLIVFICSVAGAPADTRTTKAIIENPECYTYKEVADANKDLISMQSYQGTIFSFHNNDDELRNLKPVDLSKVNNATNFDRKDINVNVSKR